MMKLVIVVVMTSLEPKRTFRKPISAPARPPPITPLNKASTRCRMPGSGSGVMPTKAATIAPVTICPSTPRLISVAFLPTINARPVKISGVAWIRVLVKERTDPSEPSMITE